MPADSKHGSLRRLLLAAVIVIAAVGCDQYSKHLARIMLKGAGTVRLIGSVLLLRHAENQGAFLSLGAGWHPLFRVLVFVALSLAIVTAGAVYLFRNRRLSLMQTVALSLVVGGGAGNLIDRLARGGQVTDFLNLGIGRLRTGIFNLADLFLMAGVAMFVLARKTKPDQAPGDRSGLP
jgi:signal peptidase II